MSVKTKAIRDLKLNYFRLANVAPPSSKYLIPEKALDIPDWLIRDTCTKEKTETQMHKFARHSDISKAELARWTERTKDGQSVQLNTQLTRTAISCYNKWQLYKRKAFRWDYPSITLRGHYEAQGRWRDY